MKKFYVYIHTCPDGKKYVGVTGRNPESRWQKGNGYQYNKHFYSAILKYGWSNFQHEVFEVESEEEMYRKEVELISFYHSNDPRYGYNNSVGGEKGTLGCKHSEETRKKMSETKKKRCSDPEYRRKLSEARKGKPFSEEHKKHLSEAQKKRRLDPEFGKKMSESTKEKWTDPEYRRKQFEAHKGQIRSEETKRHISEAKKGTHLSEETKRRMSETAKNRPKVKIKLPDGTLVETTKNIIVRDYVNKGRKFEYVS